MKKYFLALLTFTLGLTISAQLPADLSKYKKIGQSESHADPDGLAAPASPSTSGKHTSSNSLIEKAVVNGLFVMHQNYQIQNDASGFFKEETNIESAENNCIGIMIINGYLWNYNPDIANVTELTSQYSELDGDADYDEINFDPAQLIKVYPNKLDAVRSDIFFNEGFKTGHGEGAVDGYLVWITKPYDLDLKKSTKLNVNAEEYTLNEDTRRSVTYQLRRPETADEVMGVLFFVAENTGIGRIELTLHGVGIEENGIWSLICPFEEGTNVISNTEVYEAQPIGDSVNEHGIFD